MAYLYVATTKKPTVVSNSIVCSLTSLQDRNLAIARGNQLEIHTLTSNGITPEKSFTLNGRITSLKKFRYGGSGQDVLFILTAKKHFTVLAWDNQTKNPIVKATGNLKDRPGCDLEFGHFVLIDPENRMIAVLVHEGQLKVSLKYSNSTLLIEQY